jgi:hypothetical protein
MNFRNKLIFYGEELLAPRPTPKLEVHPLSAVRDVFFTDRLNLLKYNKFSFLPQVVWGAKQR